MILFFIVGLSTSNAQRFNITVTQVKFHIRWLEVFGVAEYESVFGSGCTDSPRMYLNIWQGTTLINKERIYPDAPMSKSIKRVGWKALEKIPDYLGDNWGWEISIEGCDFKIKYP